jgi:hypothetical protein
MERFRNLIEHRTLRRWIVPLVLLFVTLLAYGLYIDQLGFYWDDWGFVWLEQFFGQAALQEHDLARHPLRYFYNLPLTALLGANAAAWQVFSVLTRWLAAVSLWWFLRQAWPRHPYTALLAALFFLVYPGFLQQPLARTYNYFWIIQMVFFLSLGLMCRGLARGGRWGPAMFVSLALTGLHLFSLDYLFGLELTRPLFIWLVLGAAYPDMQERLRQTFRTYLPFVLVLVVYLYWRIFVFSEAMYRPALFGAGGEASLTGLFSQLLLPLPLVSLGAWAQTVTLPSLGEFGPRLLAGYLLAVLFCISGLPVIVHRILDYPDPPEGAGRWGGALGWVGMGLLALLVAGIPVHAAGLPIRLEFPEDRLTMPFMFGVSLILAGTFALIKERGQRMLLASLLITLAVGFHIQNTFRYYEATKQQNQFIWQLAWRAPALAPGTTILADQRPLSSAFNDDEAITAMLNWTYAPALASAEMPYVLVYIPDRLGHVVPALERHLPVEVNWVATFNGSTDRVLFLRHEPPSCLRILHPVYDRDLIFLPYMDNKRLKVESRFLPSLVVQALPLSDLNGVVLPEPKAVAAPPEALFGPEPKHAWCYYFQKADLARQREDWEQVARLGDEAFARSRYPLDLSEYLPFIEAYARLGRRDEAQQLTHWLAETAPVINPALCGLWQRVGSGPASTAEDRRFAEQMKIYLGVCPYP